MNKTSEGFSKKKILNTDSAVELNDPLKSGLKNESDSGKVASNEITNRIMLQRKARDPNQTH